MMARSAQRAHSPFGASPCMQPARTCTRPFSAQQNHGRPKLFKPSEYSHVHTVRCQATSDQAGCDYSRRAVLASAAAVLAARQSACAAEVPAAPQVGTCADCIGEVETTLNVCSEESASCISTQNDDEAHFVPPWSYDGAREAAVERLISVATGGGYDPGLSNEPLGISRSSAAAYILGGVSSVVQGKPMPEKPERAVGAAEPFDGILQDRHVTKEGAEYVRVTFGTQKGTVTDVDDPSTVVDAEFLFLADDSIVVLRSASRAEPSRSKGKLSLSFTKGVVFDSNFAAQDLERLRKALRWEIVPVITDFDPRFNGSKKLWFENLYQPFVRARYGNNPNEQQEDQSERPLIDGKRF